MHTHLRTALLLLTITALFPSSAGAQYARSFEFESDGVRPSADPDVEYVTDFDAEADVVTVAGGTMAFETVGRTQAYYQIEAPALDLAGDFTLELRLRIDAMEGTSHGGFAVLVSDGSEGFNLLFRPDGVAVNVESGVFGTGDFFPLDHSVFRTYELVAAGGSGLAELRVDGAPLGSVAAASSGLGFVGWAFGDLVNAVSNADTTVEFVRLTVPEPGTTGAGLVALGTLSALSRARSRVHINL